jgi:hypothetical protein
MAAVGNTKAANLTIKSIGTASRDYSTMVAWEAACPASLVATDEIWWGQLYPDSVFQEAPFNIQTITVDERRFLKLSCAPAHYHAGVPGTGVVVKPMQNAEFICWNLVNYTWFDGIEFSGEGIYLDDVDCTLADPFKCIDGTSQKNITNCIFHDFQVFDTDTPGFRKVDEAGCGTSGNGVEGVFGTREWANAMACPDMYAVPGGSQTTESAAIGLFGIAPPDPTGSTPNIKDSGAAYTSNSAVGVDTLTLTKPTGSGAPAVGDTLLIFAASDDTLATDQFGQWSVTQGFNFITTDHAAGVPDVHVAIFTKICDGTEAATIDVVAESVDDLAGFYVVVENAGEGITPWSWGTFTGTAHVVTEITTPVNNALAFYLLGFDGNETGFSVAGTGWSEVAEESVGAAGQGIGLTFGTKDMATAGLTGDATVTSPVSDGSVFTQFCLIPQNDAPNIKNGGAAYLMNTQVAASSITATKPTGANAPSVGDLLIILVGNDSIALGPEFDDVTYKPTGFDLIGTAGNSTVDVHVAAFSRVATGSEGATIACPALSSADMWCAYIVVENQHTTYATAIDAWQTTNDSGTPWIGTGVTTTKNDCLVFAIASLDGEDLAPVWMGEKWGMAYVNVIEGRGGVMMNNLIYAICFDREHDHILPLGKGYYDSATSDSTTAMNAFIHNTVVKCWTGIEAAGTVNSSSMSDNLFIAGDDPNIGLNCVGTASRDFVEGNAGNSNYSYAEYRRRLPADTFVDWANDDFHIKKDHYIGCGVFPLPFMRYQNATAASSVQNQHQSHPRWYPYVFHDIAGDERGYTDPDQDIVPGCFGYTLASDEARWTKKTIKAADGDYTTLTAWEAALTADTDPSTSDSSDRGEIYMGWADAKSYDESLIMSMTGCSQHSSATVLRPATGIANDHRFQRDRGVRIEPTGSGYPCTVDDFARVYGIAARGQSTTTAPAAFYAQLSPMLVNCFGMGTDTAPITVARSRIFLSGGAGTAFIGCGAVGGRIDSTSTADQEIRGFELASSTIMSFLFHCTAMGFTMEDETPAANLEFVGYFHAGNDSSSGLGNLLAACLFVADESDAAITGYFTRDNQATQAGWDAAQSFHCFSSCAGTVGSGGGFPDVNHEGEGALSETLIFTEEGEETEEPNLDATGTNVMEVANAMRMSYEDYLTDVDQLTLYPLVLLDANGATRKNTPGCVEAGGSPAPVLTVNGLDNNSATFRYTGVPASALTGETDIVEASGDFASPFSQNSDTPPFEPYTMTGLTERFDWMARLRYLDEYGWPSFWSSTVYFATLALLRERPRLGPLVNYGRGGLAWMVDRRGALVEMAKHYARLGHWVKISGAWRRVLLLEEPRTNKCHTPLDYEAGPPPTINFDSQSAGAIFESVADADALNDAGLQAVVPEDRVVHADNSEGSSQWVALKGECGNTNVHALSVIARGTGTLKLGLDDGSGETDFTLTPQYQRFFITATPSASTLNLRVRIPDGDEIWFVLPQLEEGNFHTSNIVQTAEDTTLLRDEESPQTTLPSMITAPQEMTIYMRFIALMDYDQVPTGATFLKIGSLITAPVAGEETWEIGMNTSDQPVAIRNVAGAEKTATLTAAGMQFDRLDEVELAIVVNSDGTWRFVGTVESSLAFGADGTTFSLAAAWQMNKVYIAPYPGAIGLIDIKIIRGAVIGSDQDILNRCRTVGYRKAP